MDRERARKKYENWYDGSLDDDFLFQAKGTCVDLNARNYRWSESRSKVYQMCDMGEDETVAHEILECEKYDSDRMKMMHAVLSTMQCEVCEVTE